MPELLAISEGGGPADLLDAPDLAEILELSASATAAYAVDLDDRIVYWNEGAERLFGWRAVETLGRGSFDILCGRDAFGNSYCAASCPVRTATSSGQELQPFAIELCSRDASRQRLRVQVRRVPEQGERIAAIVHLVEPAELDDLFEGVRSRARSPRPGSGFRPDSPLTNREHQILEFLAEGLAAQGAAAKLGISHATVRNHIQNILRKIEVHGQVEAVAVALRRGWI